MSVAGAEDGLRLGVVLPSFRSQAEDALHGAEEAEALGLHGVFAYDHLWPMGHPGRPALFPFPLLAAVAARTSRISLGTLVARVGLTSTDVLVAELRTLAALAPGRTVFAIGTGDHKSAAENRAFGIAFAPAAARRALVEEVARELVRDGLPVWIGGGAPATNALARELGVTLNLWEPDRDAVRTALGEGPTSWGGMLPDDAGAAAGLLSDLAALGVTWAVLGWPGELERLVHAAQRAGVPLAARTASPAAGDLLR